MAELIKTVQLTTDCVCNGAAHKSGEILQVGETDARQLVALGRGKLADKPAPQKSTGKKSDKGDK